jgi:GNAT superfamily N-acetyltransferase
MMQPAPAATTIGPAKPDSAAALARLQCAILPDSRMSLLGEEYVEACYRYFLRSPQEFVLAAGSQGRIVGGAFVSLAPHSLSRRLLLHTPLLPALARRPFGPAARRMVSDVLRPDPVPSAIRELPEMVAIFVESSQRGAGIGEAICRAAEEELARRKAIAYVVRTENHPGNRALAFYHRLGFAEAAAGPDTRFVYLTKLLPSPAAGRQ